MSEILEAQNDLIDEFEVFDNWLDKYQYLIDLGRKLTDLPDELKSEENRLHGCQSQVWIVADFQEGRLNFHAISDSAIVSGLIAILMRVYSSRTPQEILETDPDFIMAIDLHEHLSPTRSNGLMAMVNAIKGYASACVD
ncbi:MAG: SufE family protein [Pseudomonadota bacterium]|nr:SufE family protein [Pseudomonadota bacterium]